jgi:prepilin-type N-terminal cleavage/methylation domain-containing protein
VKKGFTLLELIVVIIILGILATLGYTQYTKLVENMRGAEAKANIGIVVKTYFVYYLEHGTNSSLTNSDLNIGSDPAQIPDSCVSTNYYSYSWWAPTSSQIAIRANRCTTGGKSPSAQTGYGWVYYIDAASGWYQWGCDRGSQGDWVWVNPLTPPGSCP